MKLNNLTISAFQGIDFLEIKPAKTKNILLFAGKNGTGKTTVKDAIRLALTGQSDRVKLIKDYPRMVRTGQDQNGSFVSLNMDGFTFKRMTATGKSETDLPDTPVALPYLLGTQSFALASKADKQSILYSITGVSRKPKDVQDMMRAMHIDEDCIEELGAPLRGGFANAVEHCKTKMAEARGAWKNITGKVFGEKQAATWAATVPDVDMDALIDTREQLSQSIADIEQRLQEATTEENSALEEVKRRNEYHALQRGQEEARRKLEETIYACPCCSAKLAISDGALVLAVPKRKPKEVARDAVPEDTPIDLLRLRRVCVSLNSERNQVLAQLTEVNTKISAGERADEEAKEKTDRAKEVYTDFMYWSAAAAALGEDGIPMRLLEKALKPVNDHLARTCKLSCWPDIKIHKDMDLSFNEILYDLCSESEKWRVDATISEMLSVMSGVKFFILDRMDVLHPDERVALLKWLIHVKADHDTIVVMATLKAPPTGLHASVQPYWLSDGGELKLEKANVGS